MKKIFYTFLLLFVFTYATASDNKTVTLITSGQGKTQDEAKQNALRNAIEQAFGAFISSHTEIVNDIMVKDEIISVSNGNIQRYEIISESVLPDNLGYTTTLKTIVSISKLTSFCESKGVQIEVKGSLFAFNVIQKELSASNEKKVLQELVLMAKNIAPKMFDYTLIANDPIKNEISNYNRNGKTVKPYCLPIKVNISINKNWENYYKILSKTLSGLAMSKAELEDYKKLNIPYYTFEIFTNKKKYNGIYKFYSCPTFSKGCSISQKDYDDDIWMNVFKIKTSNPSRKSYSGSGAGILAAGFNNGNYESSKLYFRSNIKSILYSIYQSINNEAFNYKIVTQAGSEIITDSYKVLFTPIDDEGGRKYYNNGTSSWGSNSSIYLITYNRGDFKKRDGIYAPVSYVNILNETSIILQQIDGESIIGFGYYNPSFDLEEIKSLSKLEVQHK